MRFPRCKRTRVKSRYPRWREALAASGCSFAVRERELHPMPVPESWTLSSRPRRVAWGWVWLFRDRSSKRTAGGSVFRPTPDAAQRLKFPFLVQSETSVRKRSQVGHRRAMSQRTAVAIIDDEESVRKSLARMLEAKALHALALPSS